MSSTIISQCQVDSRGQPPGPGWLRSLLGEDFFSEVDFVAIQHLSEPARERRDELNRIYGMSLNGTNVVDVAMERLDGLTRLHHLYLTDSEVGDGQLVRLQGLTELQTLDLSGTKITDAGLSYVKAYTHLDTLWLGKRNITDAGIAELQKALPNCEIRR
jgi:Leucine Rich repeat